MHARADRTNETSVVSPAGSYSVVFRTVIPHVSGEAVGLGPVQWVDIEIFSNLTIIMRLIDAAGDFRFALEFFFVPLLAENCHHSTAMMLGTLKVKAEQIGWRRHFQFSRPVSR